MMVSDKIKYFFPKLSNRLRLYRNRLWKHCDVEHIAMKGYKPFDNTVAFKSRIHEMLGLYDANILVGISDEDEKVIITCADQALRHEFDLLGSGPIVLNPIDWHTDFKVNVRWDKKYYKEISGIKGADIKVPWELSRCQHLLWLGEAYLLTGNSDYAKEVIDEVNWWIDDNPFMYSVNWGCAMDVAFRAVNWLFSLNMISGYEGFDDVFSEKVSSSLWQHGFYIRNNLEKLIPFSNNHYASDIVGLLYIGALFRESSKANKWFKFALKEFYSEIKIQVLESGVHYERSVSYHRMMTEMLSYPIYMLRRIGENVPSEILGRIGKMYAYVSLYTKPNGYAPLIGDNDDGRFVPFLNRDFRIHNYLNDTLSVECRFVSIGIPMLFSGNNPNNKLFKDAGCAIIRKGCDYLFINNSGYSKHPKETECSIPSHTHNDLLSFELCLNGKELLVDNGTYLYTSSAKDRDVFRSTAMHNTIVVDDEEQNGFIAPFYLNRNVQIESLSNTQDGAYEGSYTTIKEGMKHIRHFDFSGDELVITDRVFKTGKGHNLKMYFHFAENVTPSADNSSIHLNLGVTILFRTIPNRIDIKDGVFSPSFGVLKRNKVTIVEFIFDNEITIDTVIKKR